MTRGSEIETLLDSIDIETWCDSQGIDYRKNRGSSGTQLNIKVCPVCGNSDYKVYLNADTGLGNCFAGSHPPESNFNKWRFISAVLDASGSATFQHLKTYASGRAWLPKKPKVQQKEKPVQLVLPQSYELPLDGRNIQYLEDRGVSAETAKRFGLRYCHEGWFFYEHEGKQRRMEFSGRVLIPVFDLDGKMVNFQGRDITGTKDPKYLFPPGLESTGSHLLNGVNVHATTRIAVGEGFFDVAAIEAALHLETSTRDVVAVGTFGKHLSWGSENSQETKFRTLRSRGVREITMMWDGEIAATKAAVDAGFRLQKLGFTVKVAMLPKDKDPNEVDPSVVRQTYVEAIPLTSVNAIRILMRRRQMNSR